MGIYLSFYAADTETIERLRGDDEAVVKWLEDADDDGRGFAVDKAWDVIGRLVSGTPSGLLEHASGPLHEEDLGYGPALLIPAGKLQLLRDSAEGKGAEAMTAFMESPGFREEPPYPFFDDVPETAAPEEVAYYAGLLDGLRAFVDEAIERGDSLVCVMG